jgi:hypothetical protein
MTVRPGAKSRLADHDKFYNLSHRGARLTVHAQPRSSNRSQLFSASTIGARVTRLAVATKRRIAKLLRPAGCMRFVKEVKLMGPILAAKVRR